MRSFLVCTAFAASLAASGSAHAITIYETATLGPTGQSGGFSIDTQWLGVRFTTVEAFTVTRLGGHMGGSGGNGMFFIAVVPIDPATDLPPCNDLSCAVFSTPVSVPAASAEISAMVNFNLPAGRWGLIVGSTEGGATATGSMPGNNPDVGTPAYMFRTQGDLLWTSGGFNQVRFFIDGDLAPVCGNGVLEAGEECDDGNANNNDDCLDTCLAAACGDGSVHNEGAGGEQCDDANANNNDDCLDTCVVATCGDGFLHSTGAGGEECDDGAGNSDTDAGACRTSCALASCGDGVIDMGESCDDGAGNSDTDAGACRTSCAPASCGDGVVDTGEACDNGAANSDTDADACRITCAVAFCGDGVTDSGEECDDATANGTGSCSATCTVVVDEPGGCGCRTAPHQPRGQLLGLLGLCAFGLILVRRRRCSRNGTRMQ